MQGVVDASVAGAAAAALPVGRTVLFSAVKDEAPFLLEWIAYHKVIGFDEIVICSNPSGDGTEELLASLAEAGQIRHIRTVVPPGQRPQGAAAFAFRKQVGHRDGDWYLWLDADEFLNVHVGDHSVAALIAGLGGKDCALINWRVFGSGGNARFPGRFIAPEFSGAAAPGFRNHLEQKAIFRASRAVVGFGQKGIHRPLVSRTAIWTHQDVVVGAGGLMSEDSTVNRRWLEGSNNNRTSKVLPAEFGWALAQINHYMVRTPEFFALKRVRGRGAYPNPEGGSNRRHTPAFFTENDRNEDVDQSILIWQDRVTEEIDRLLQFPGVAVAKAASDRLVAEILTSQNPAAGVAVVADLPTLSAVTATDRPRRVLFSAMKNEGPFVLEWIAYHKAIGFDEIVICSNPSTDGMEQVLEALAAAGEITHLRAVVPAGDSPQIHAVRAFQRDVGFRDGDWYLWLDGDEFLNVHVGDRTVMALITAMQHRQCALINWRVFGSSGHFGFPGRFVSADFVGASRPDFVMNRIMRGLFRYSRAFSGFAVHGIHRPLIAQDSGLTLDDILTGNGQPAQATGRSHLRWLTGEDFTNTSRLNRGEAGWTLAQVNHYIVRTGEFFRLKRVRGRGIVSKTKSKVERHTDAFFAEHDRNEEEDRSILFWHDRVTVEIDRLLRVPDVAEAKAASDRLVAEILASQTALPVALPVEPGPAATADLPSTSAAATPGHPRRVLFSAMKNEAPFLLEWVAYHKAIGFDDIVICSNPSNDGTEDVLAALGSAGEITHLRADPQPGESPQGQAARVFAQSRGYQDGSWYLWLDADEFLNVHVGQRTVDDLVKAVGGHDCLFINWRIFGSNGNATFPGRVLDLAFSRAAAPGFAANAGLKSFFRMSGKFAGFATVGIHRPLVNKDGGLAGTDVLTGSGQPLSADLQRHRNWLSGASYAPNWTVDAPEVGWGLAQINHYMVRTPEFFALKKARGRGWQADSVGDANLRHTAGFFQTHDRNEDEDRSILVWQDRVTAEIARLTADPGVAAASARAAGLVAGLVAGLMDGTAAALPPAADPSPGVLETTPAPSFKLTFPPAEARHVREAYARAGMILEYGSGGSTVLAAELGKPVISVESDKAWAETLAARLAPISSLARMHHVDIGPTEKWGMPSRPRFHGRFHAYALSVWDRPDIGDPDLVLIDGRFRAACLAAVLLRAKAPTTVLIDDYIDRPHYHDVEALARKDGMIGRMARFTVTPGPIPPEMLTTVIGWFSDPR